MITYFLVRWYLFGTYHCGAYQYPVIDCVIAWSLGVGLTTTIILTIAFFAASNGSPSKEDALKLFTIAALSFGFSIFMPIIIDICLTIIALCIPVTIFKSVTFLLKTVSTSLDRKFEKYRREAYDV